MNAVVFPLVHLAICRTVGLPLLLSKLTILQYMCLYVCVCLILDPILTQKQKSFIRIRFTSLHGSTSNWNNQQIRIQQNAANFPPPRRGQVDSRSLGGYKVSVLSFRLLRFILYKIWTKIARNIKKMQPDALLGHPGAISRTCGNWCDSESIKSKPLTKCLSCTKQNVFFCLSHARKRRLACVLMLSAGFSSCFCFYFSGLLEL